MSLLHNSSGYVIFQKLGSLPAVSKAMIAT